MLNGTMAKVYSESSHEQNFAEQSDPPKSPVGRNFYIIIFGRRLGDRQRSHRIPFFQVLSTRLTLMRLCYEKGSRSASTLLIVAVIFLGCYPSENNALTESKSDPEFGTTSQTSAEKLEAAIVKKITHGARKADDSDHAGTPTRTLLESRIQSTKEQLRQDCPIRIGMSQQLVLDILVANSDLNHNGQFTSGYEFYLDREYLTLGAETFFCMVLSHEPDRFEDKAVACWVWIIFENDRVKKMVFDLAGSYESNLGVPFTLD